MGVGRFGESYGVGCGEVGGKVEGFGKVGGWVEGGCGVWGKLRSEFGGMAGLGRTREWVGGVRLS